MWTIVPLSMQFIFCRIILDHEAVNALSILFFPSGNKVSQTVNLVNREKESFHFTVLQPSLLCDDQESNLILQPMSGTVPAQDRWMTFKDPVQCNRIIEWILWQRNNLNMMRFDLWHMMQVALVGVLQSLPTGIRQLQNNPEGEEKVQVTHPHLQGTLF